jgi:hypothetical protein
MIDKNAKLHLQYPIYTDLIMGLPDSSDLARLNRDPAAHCCWHFYTLAEKTRLTVGKGPESQIILEDMPWMDPRYEQLARSVSLLYGFNSPDDWQNYWPMIEEQAVALGYGKPSQEYHGRKRLIIH